MRPGEAADFKRSVEDRRTIRRLKEENVLMKKGGADPQEVIKLNKTVNGLEMKLNRNERKLLVVTNLHAELIKKETEIKKLNVTIERLEMRLGSERKKVENLRLMKKVR